MHTKSVVWNEVRQLCNLKLFANTFSLRTLWMPKMVCGCSPLHYRRRGKRYGGPTAPSNSCLMSPKTICRLALFHLYGTPERLQQEFIRLFSKFLIHNQILEGESAVCTSPRGGMADRQHALVRFKKTHVRPRGKYSSMQYQLHPNQIWVWVATCSYILYVCPRDNAVWFMICRSCKKWLKL